MLAALLKICLLYTSPKDFNEYNEYQSKYESLKADEKRLDRLFDKTSYGKELIVCLLYTSMQFPLQFLMEPMW